MKVLVLNKKEVEALKSQGYTTFKKKGETYTINNHDPHDLTCDLFAHDHMGQVINPCDFGGDRIVLTVQEGKELQQTGHTTHTKNGVEYEVFYRDPNHIESICALPKNEYTHVIIDDELIAIVDHSK